MSSSGFVLSGSLGQERKMLTDFTFKEKFLIILNFFLQQF